MQSENRGSRIIRRSPITHLLLVILAAGGFSRAALGAEDVPSDRPISVAVLNFVNRNPGDGWDWLGTGLADMLITDLSKSASLIVVERERMAWMIRELRLGEAGVVDASTVGSIGRTCKVDRVLCGGSARPDAPIRT